MADFGELWTRFKEQEVVSYKLVLVLPVLVVIGIIVWGVVKLTGSSDIGIGTEAETYYCVFDDGEVKVSTQELYAWQNRGDAILRRGPGPPNRVRCPECDRPSCIKADPETGEETLPDPEWDLEQWPDDDESAGRGGRIQP